MGIDLFNFHSLEDYHTEFKTTWKLASLHAVKRGPIKTWLRLGPPYPTDFDVETNVLITSKRQKMKEVVLWLNEFEGNKIWFCDGLIKEPNSPISSARNYLGIAIIAFQKRIDIAILKLTFGMDVLITEQE